MIELADHFKRVDIPATILVREYLAYSWKDGTSGGGKHCRQGPAAKRRVQLPSRHLEVLESQTTIIVRTEDSKNKPPVILYGKKKFIIL